MSELLVFSFWWHLEAFLNIKSHYLPRQINSFFFTVFSGLCLPRALPRVLLWECSDVLPGQQHHITFMGGAAQMLIPGQTPPESESGGRRAPGFFPLGNLKCRKYKRLRNTLTPKSSILSKMKHKNHTHFFAKSIFHELFGAPSYPQGHVELALGFIPYCPALSPTKSASASLLI